jgi:hypothetical protein
MTGPGSAPPSAGSVEPGPFRTAGLVAATGCGVGVAVFLVGPDGASVYDVARWILLVGLATGSTLLLASSSRSVLLGSLAAVVVLAGQLSATGIVAFRHWSALCGPSACNLLQVDVERPLAVVLAVTMFVVAVTGATALLRAGAFLVPPALWVAVVAVAAGGLIAAVLPFVLGERRSTAMAGYAFVYSLPWGLTLVATAWLRRIPALAAAAVVVASSAGVAVTKSHIAFVDQRSWFFVATVLAAAVLATRVRGDGSDSPIEP